jgi:N-acetylglucosamine-6-sulfatase
VGDDHASLETTVIETGAPKIAVIAAFMVASACPVWAEAPAPRPNFVFFLVDDLQARGTGATGHPYGITPNIDGIAHQGMRFTRAHVTTPLCAPSRASFLSGMYSRTHGVIDNRGIDLDPSVHPSFAQYLQDAGYATAFVGKWHQELTDRLRPGFDMWAGFAGQGEYYGTPDHPIVIRHADQTGERVDRYIDGEYNTDLLTSYAVDWLHDLARTGSEEPFCLLIWYKAVHGPRQPAERHADLYTGQRYLPLPPSVTRPVPDAKPPQVAQQIIWWNALPDNLQELYLDPREINSQRTLAAVDDSVGAVIRAVDELGELGETVVVFASDNGRLVREFGLADKRWLYEPSTRIPLFISYPRMVEPGSTSSVAALNIDVAPTLLDLAGIPIPLAIQGRTLKPVLEGSVAAAPPWRRSWFFEYSFEHPFAPPTGESVTVIENERSLKHIRYPWAPADDELYDLTGDPDEITNILPTTADAGDRTDLAQELARLRSVAFGPDPLAPTVDLFERIRLDGWSVDHGLWLRYLDRPDGRTEKIRISGRLARRTLPESRYVYLDLDDGWRLFGDLERVDVMVEYLDEGRGRLWIEYDSSRPGQDPDSDAHRPSATLSLEDTGTWRTQRFLLERARFAGRLGGGADLRIATDPGDSLVVDRVTVNARRPRRATLDLGRPDVYRLLYRVDGSDAAAEAADVAGRVCRRTTAPTSVPTMAFALADVVAFAGDPTGIRIGVEYLDQGDGLLILEYDGSGGVYSRSAAVRLRNTGRWRHNFFELRDAVFANRQRDGSDFRIRSTGSDLTIDHVSVDRRTSRDTPRDGRERR